MSFTAEVKNELTRVTPSCPMCDKATLAALLRIEGSLYLSGKGRYRVEVVTDIAVVARLIIRLLHSEYDLYTELTVRRSVLHKTPNYLITLPQQPRLEMALRDLGFLAENGLISMGVDPRLVERECCASAYLRGVFMGCGFVSSPKGDFHFEMTVETEELAQNLADLMRAKGINAHVLQRRSSYIVYLKSGSAITDFLTYTGAHQCALKMESIRVVKSARNEANRIANADFANSARAGDAAQKQIQDIQKVANRFGLESLTPALRDYAHLRLENPGISLKDLGELADPPLSKSAMYHRVRRMEELAAQI